MRPLARTPNETLDQARASWLAGRAGGWTAYKRCVCGLADAVEAERSGERPRSARRARRRGRA